MSLPKTRMARTVRPDDFFDESLMKAEVTSGLPIRITYIALHTMADREGRFVWNTQTVRYLSLDEPDVIQASLVVLHKINKISKYHVNGEDYGLINDFTRTQHINPREKQSALPAIKTNNMILPDGSTVEMVRKPKAPAAVITSEETDVSGAAKAKNEDVTHYNGYVFKRIPKCGLWRYGDSHEMPVMVSTAEDISESVAVLEIIGGAVRQLGISELKVREYDEVYPNADNIARVKKAAQWCKENEAKRKTQAGILRFLNQWVSSAQNKGEFLITGTGVALSSGSTGFRGKVDPDEKAGDTARKFSSLFNRTPAHRAQTEKEVQAV